MSLPARPSSVLTACALGELRYAEGIALQEALVDARAAGETGDWLLFPDHPPVLTVGRGSDGQGLRVPRAALERLGVELFEVARGGDITWHGPGQLVGYVICDLGCVGKDLHRFLRGLEEALQETLGRFGIAGRRVPGRTGVWVGERKIASIGVAVRRWVSYYGFALNVSPDLRYFDLIHPCGLKGVRMTSMAELLGAGAPPLAVAREAVAVAVAGRLGLAGPAWAEARAARAFLAAAAPAAAPAGAAA